jgi:hypothetical protein
MDSFTQQFFPGKGRKKGDWAAPGAGSERMRHRPTLSPPSGPIPADVYERTQNPPPESSPYCSYDDQLLQ